MTIGGIDPLAVGKDTLREMKDDDVPGLAAELTYRTFLALFPFMIFLAALGALIADVFDIANPADRFVDLFGDQLPADAQSVIHDQVQEVLASQKAGLLSVGVVGALWAASGGAGALMKALNRAYDFPDSRPFWKQKLLALGLVLAGTVAILGSVSLLVATQVFGEEIADSVGLGATFEVLIRWGTFPLVLVVLFWTVGFAFWVAPNAHLPFRWITPGAVVFVAGWAVATVGFSLYVGSMASYNATYGTLGGVVVLLFWFYLSFMALLIGAEVNSVLDEQAIGGELAARRTTARAAMRLQRGEAAGAAEPAEAATVPATGVVPEATMALETAGVVAAAAPEVALTRLAAAAPEVALTRLAPAEGPREHERPRAAAALVPVLAFASGIAVAALAVRKIAR